MAVPVLVFLVSFGVGVVASARWLPELAAGPVGGLAFFAVCGLLAAALGLAGLHAYAILNAIDNRGLLGDLGKAEILASGLRSLLFECGTLVGLACIVYLLAPRLREETPAVAAREPEVVGS